MRIKPPPIDLADLLEQAKKGTSAQRLAARYHRSVRTITAIAKRHGIKLKTHRQTKTEVKQILSRSAYEEPRQGH